MTAPFFGSQSVPVRIRALFAVGISLIIVPTYWSTPLEYPGSVLGLFVLIAGEALVGLALGLGVLILFTGVQVAGQIIGQLSGMSLADVFNPAFDSNSPIFSQILFYVTMAVFLLIGGHRMILSGLLDTFEVLPPGLGTVSESITYALVTILHQSFVVGIRAVAPVMASLLLATLVMGLVSRTLPQLNILTLGFGLNALILQSALLFSLGGVAWTMQDQIEPILGDLQQAMLEGAADVQRSDGIE